MATPTKRLMDLYADEMKAAFAADDFDRAQAFSLAESTVNNYMHGRYPAETFTLVKNHLQGVLDDGLITEESEKAGLVDAIMLLDLLVEELS